MPTAIDAIVARAPTDLFASGGSGHSFLRLEILGQILAPERKLRSSGAALSEYATRAVMRRDYFDAVMYLLDARMRNKEAVENAISVVYGTERVSWNQFYFGSGEHGEAYDRVVATRGDIPIAVRGPVDWVSIRTHEETGAEFAVIAHPRVRRRSSNPAIEGIRLSLWSHSTKAFNECVAGEELLSFGLWDQLIVDDPSTVTSEKKVPSPLGVARLMTLSSTQIRIVTSENGVYRNLKHLPIDRPPKRDGREQDRGLER